MAFAYVFGKRSVRVAFDRYVVFIVQYDKFAEFKSSGKRGGFVFDAFHHTSVAAKGVSVVIDDREAFAIKFRRKVAFGDCHTYRVGDTLSERSGSRFDSGRMTVFRMPRSSRIELTEVFQIFHRNVVSEKM